MVKGKSLRRAAPWVSSALLLAGLATPVLARGFKDESLTLRLPAALSRFATYGDVAGLGGASAGSKWSSSVCLLYTSPSPRDQRGSRMPSSA